MNRNDNTKRYKIAKNVYKELKIKYKYKEPKAEFQKACDEDPYFMEMLEMIRSASEGEQNNKEGSDNPCLKF